MKSQFEPQTKVFIGIGMFIFCFFAVVILTALETPNPETQTTSAVVNERAVFIMRCANEGAKPEHCACIYDKVVIDGLDFSEDIVAQCVINSV